MSDVEVISIDDDDGEEGGGRSDTGLDAEGETSGQDGQDDEDVQIGDSRNYHQQGQEHHQLQGPEHRRHNSSNDHNTNSDDEDGSEPEEEEIFSQDPQGLEESKIIESCCRQQQASMSPLLIASEDGDGEDQFGSFAYAGAEPTEDEDELISTQRQELDQTQRHREQGAPQQPTSSGPWRSPPRRPDVSNCVDLTLSEPREHHRPLRGQGAAAALSGFRSEYAELLERTQEERMGFPFEAVAELLLRHPKHWWCR